MRLTTSQLPLSDQASISELKANLPVESIALLTVKALPSKGRALVALTDLAPGTRLLVESPLLTAPRSLSPPALESYIRVAIKDLSKKQQRQYLSLQNNWAGQYPFGGIIPSNAYPCGSDADVSAVYPTICLLNHSCMPNCQHTWNSEKKVQTVYTIRPIKKGEELTVSYEVSGPAADRIALLEKSFGFRCACEICNLPSEEQIMSDTRQLAIQRLDERLSRLHSRHPLSALHDCHLLLQILRAEYAGYPGVFEARVYWDAFQITVANGDLARAKVFAERSWKAAVICEGEETPEVRSVRALVDDPAGDKGFEKASKEWNTDVDMVPKRLGEDEFETWLFRRN